LNRKLQRPDSRRFAFFFELHLHLERKFDFRGQRWAWRAGANNITNRHNPDTVNPILGASQFLTLRRVRAVD
jgi:hypothetical protein